MIKIHRLKQPNKHSGTPLQPGQALELRGMKIYNHNKFEVYVDTFARKPWKPAKESKKNVSEAIKSVAKKHKKEAKSSAAHI